MLFDFTFEGNLAYAPELRYTDSGVPVCKLRVIHNTRRFADGKWQDGRSVTIDVTCWRKLAEHVAQLLQGDAVIVTARPDLEARAYEGRGFLTVTAENVALSLRFRTAASSRAPKKRTGADTVQTPEREVFPAEEFAHADERAAEPVPA